jgi:hypothetical protein
VWDDQGPYEDYIDTDCCCYYYYYYYYYYFERIERELEALCYIRLFSKASQSKYEYILVRLNILPLHVLRRHFEAIFLFHTFKGNITSSSILDSDGLRIPSKSIMDFSTFLLILTSRPVPLQEMFLLPTQSVGTLMYLTKITFY